MWGRRLEDSVVRICVVSSDGTDAGVGVVIRARPFTVVIPTHLATSLALAEATEVRVDDEDIGWPAMLAAPAAGHDELTLLRFPGRGPAGRRAARLPFRPARLRLGEAVALLLPAEEERSRLDGRVTALKLENDQEWISSDVPCSRGSSGGALIAGGHVVGICQAMTASSAGDDASSAIAIRLSQATLREVARLSGRYGRRTAWSLAALASVGALAVLLAASRALPSLGDRARNTAAPSPAASTLRALYIYGSGSTNPALMIEKLQSAGFYVATAAIAPSGLDDYSLVVAHVNAASPEQLATFVRRGGGLVMLEATPYYLGVSDIAAWLGAHKYVNAAVCVYARVATDHPMGTEFVTGDIVAKSACAWEGAAAMAELDADAVVFARWESPDCAFAFGHRYGDGRVYYQAQFGGAYVGEAAWTLFLAGARWATGLAR